MWGPSVMHTVEEQTLADISVKLALGKLTCILETCQISSMTT